MPVSPRPTTAEDRRDVEYLGALARAVCDALARLPAPALTLRPGQRMRETYTDGYAVTVAGFRDRSPGTFGLWLDRYAGPGPRRLSYSFGAQRRERVEEIAAAAQATQGRPTLHLRKDDMKDAGGARILRTPFTARDYGRPVLETYTAHQNAQFYGVYVERVVPNEPVPPALVEQIVRFAHQVGAAVLDARSRTGGRATRAAAADAEAAALAQAVSDAAEHSGSRRAGAGQGFARSPAAIKALEAHGMRQARAYLKRRFPGCSIVDVSAREPYDLQCRTDDRELCVEVKCTQGTGRVLIITRNEAEFAVRHPRKAALFVLSGAVVGGTAARPTVSGGTAAFEHPWRVDAESLEVVSYRLRR